MKRFLVIVLMLAGMAAAQTTLGPTNIMLLGIGTYTGATLQSRFPAANWPWYTAWVTDGPTCGGGGPGPAVLCYSNGTAWTAISTGTGGPGSGGTVTNNGSLVQGQPTYGNGSVVIQTVPTELAADTFTGSDICVKVMAAEAALPTTGGVILLSAQTYPTCGTSITINKRNITLRGAGMGNWGLGTAATVLNFPAGVSGIVSTSEITVIKDMMIKSASTVAGSDNGISFAGGSPEADRVIVQHFGGRGVVLNNNTDLWRLDSVYADSNKGDGFYLAPSCTDQNAGFAVGTSATNNGGIGYNIQCGSANYFQTTHAANNAGGAWMVNSTYNFITNAYVEGGAGSSFTFAPGTAYNTATFNAFGQPSPITDLGINSTNTIYYEGAGGGDGNYPAQTSLSLTGPPQATSNGFYSFIVGSSLGYGYYPGELAIRDRKNGVNLAYYANGHGWNFLTPMTVGVDGTIAGVLNVSGISGAYHTTIKTQATGANALFNLPPNNGVAGQVLITDGSGNTNWNTVSGGPGGVSSVTGAGSVSCTPTTGNVVCTGSATGITNSAPANVVMKSDGTNAISSSLTDNGTTVVTPEPFNAATLSTGSGASGCPPGGCFSLAEASTPGAPTLAYDYCRADSVTHGLLCSFNGNPEAPLGGSSSVAFGSVLPGTNTGALVMGTGGSLTASGGTIAATSVPAAGVGAGTISNNTSGTAANLSGTPALPNGTTATTQTSSDNSTKIATTAFVQANTGIGAVPCKPFDQTQVCIVEEFMSGGLASGTIGAYGWNITTIGSAGGVTVVSSTWPHVGIRSLNTAATATQFQGESIYIGNQLDTPGLGANANWTFYMMFQLQDITTTELELGLLGTVNANLASSIIGLRYNVNSPLSSQAITSINCTTATTCTVTNAGGTLNLPGQQITIAGAVCPTRNVNGTQLMTHFTNATTWQFTTAAAAVENCGTPGTATTVAETTFKAIVQNANGANATVVDTGITADTNWHSITIQSTTAGTATFTLDSGSPISISTSMPSSQLTMGAILCTDSTLTSAKSLYLDRAAFQMTGLTR